ncbi:MAG: helix-turn-helix domain-containing protein [Actinomycetota bacterium]|nr:helix-turn-helix domain-containing protein [Actinomycetota bacterium]
MSTTENLPPTISVERAGELLGVSRRAAYRAASRGQIPTFRVGRRLLVPTQRLLELLGMHTPDEAPTRISPRFTVEQLSTSTPALVEAGTDAVEDARELG